jgi:L,D-transpeptidase ErfK/SrfK
MRTLFVSIAFASAAFSAGAQDAPRIEKQAAPKLPAKAQPVFGQFEKYTVQRGDTITKLARSRNVSVAELLRINGRTSQRIRAGQKLIMPTLHILPRNPGTGVVLNIPERAVYVVRDGNLVERHPVAVGLASWQTAMGTFAIRNKAKNPTWTPTAEMEKREGKKRVPVPPGPNNPLGDRWIGWSKPGFGFHGTIAPRSIGRVASHGCVRLYPESIRKMYEQVQVGMPILSVYERVVIGKRDDRYFVSVFPDPYDLGGVTLEKVVAKLKAAGVAEPIDQKALAKIINAQTGFPTSVPIEQDAPPAEDDPEAKPEPGDPKARVRGSRGM